MLRWIIYPLLKKCVYEYNGFQLQSGMGRTPRQLIGSRPHGKEAGWRTTAPCQRLRSVGLVTVRDQTLQHTTIKKCIVSMGIIFWIKGQNRPALYIQLHTIGEDIKKMVLLPWEIPKYILGSQKWISQRFRQGSISAGRGTIRLWALVKASLRFWPITRCVSNTFFIFLLIYAHLRWSYWCFDNFLCFSLYVNVSIKSIYISKEIISRWKTDSAKRHVSRSTR